MRIIAGEFRSRRLKTVPGMAVRPTSDRLRETLFNVLGGAVAGSVFVDCYAGSGAVGLEALSRGAAQAIFLEQAKAALKVLQTNIAALGVAGRTRVISGPVDRGLRRLAEEGLKPGVVFIDPPYDATDEYISTFRLLKTLVGRETIVIAEHRKAGGTPALPGPIRTVNQGDSALSFYRLE